MNENNKEKIKICFLIPQLISGGAERVVSILSSKLAEKGHDVSIIIFDRFPGEYKTSDKVKRYYLCDENYNANSILKKLQRLNYIRSYIKDNNVEFVVPFLARAVLVSFIATLGIKKVLISTLRNNPYELDFSERLKTDFIVQFTDAHYVQNHMQKNYYRKRIQKKTFVLANPVDDVFLDNKKDYSNIVSRIVAVGRLYPQKNYDLLIDAMKKVKSEGYRPIVNIYGAGPEEKHIRERISSEGLSDTVFLKGRTTNVLGALQNSDLFVMTSDYEGIPNSLLEAMAFGLPCISTDCPTGPGELIKNGENGYLVKVGDSDSLAKMICRAIDKPLEAVQMGKKARQDISEKYSLNSISEQFIYECTKCRKKHEKN